MMVEYLKAVIKVLTAWNMYKVLWKTITPAYLVGRAECRWMVCGYFEVQVSLFEA